MRLLKILSVISALFMAACGVRANNPDVEVVSPQEFQQRLNEDSKGYLLDVRKPEEFAEGHLQGAALLNWLDPESFRQGVPHLDNTKTIYVYCRSGRRSNEAADYLAGQGYKVVDMRGGILGWEKENLPVVVDSELIRQIESQGIMHDSFKTSSGKNVNIHFIKHASLILDIDGRLIYIDPTGIYGTDFSKLPAADAIMVTHEHHDHFDPEAIKEISKSGTRFICNGRVAQLSGSGEVMAPGDSLDIDGILITATPAYNISEGHLQYHPKDRKDVGFIYDIDGLRIYVAGDTEDIPELSGLKDIDIAFLPVNQPYTMTPQQAVNAINMVHPKIVYPYHFGQTDLTPIVDAFKDNDSIEIRLRELQ